MLPIVRVRLDTDMILSSYCHRSYIGRGGTFHLASLDTGAMSTVPVDVLSDETVET